MIGRREHGRRVAARHHLALEHDRDLVGDPLHRAEVVGDEEIGDAEVVLQLFQQPEDLFSDQLIERRRHLVADDEIGFGGQRPGDRHPLLLSARQFAGLAGDERLRQIHLPQQFGRAGADFLARAVEIEGHRPADRLEQGMLRIEGDVRHLVDHLHPAQLVLGAILEPRRQARAVEPHVAGDARQEAGDDARQGRFARARFADHRHRIALAHLEADVVDDLRLAGIVGADMVDGEDRDLGGDVRVDEIVAGDALGHQAAGIFLPRLLQDLPRIAELDHLAAPQHHDPVGDLGDDGEVVGDVERRRAMLADELAEGGETFDLGRHVERGGRFVEDEDVGLGDHRHRRHHPLKLSAGNLMGIARADRLGARQIELLEQADRLGLRLRPRQHAVPDRRLADLLHQRMGGIERGRRALGDIGDLRSAQRAPLVEADGADVGVAEDDVAADDMAVAARIAHRGEADRRLAGAGFADEADHLAAPQLQRHVVDQHRPVAGVGAHGDAHAADVEDDGVVLGSGSVLELLAHAPSPWPLE